MTLSLLAILFSLVSPVLAIYLYIKNKKDIAEQSRENKFFLKFIKKNWPQKKLKMF